MRPLRFFVPTALCAALLTVPACDSQPDPAAAPAPAPVPVMPAAGEPVPAEAAPAPVVPPAETPAPADSPPAATAGPVPAAPDPAPAAAPAKNGAAVEAFKLQMKEIRDFVDGHNKVKPEDGLKTMLDLFGKMRAVPTDNLPEDLGSAYRRLVQVMDNVEAALNQLPVPATQLDQWAQEESAKGPAAAAAMQKILTDHQARMSEIQKEGATATARLKEVAARYGIEPVDIGADQ